MRGRGFLSWRLRFRSAFRNAGMIEDPAKQAIERLRQTSRAFRQMLSRSARWPLAAIELPLQRQFPVLMGFFYGRDIARMHEVEHGSAEYRSLWLEYLRFLLSYGADPTFIDLGLTGRLEEGAVDLILR